MIDIHVVIGLRAYLHIHSELYRGISASPFPSEVAQKLDAQLNPGDIEIKSDGKCTLSIRNVLIYKMCTIKTPYKGYQTFCPRALVD